MMKKIFLSASAALISLSVTLLPLSGLADIWTSSGKWLNKITSPNGYGPCGDPTQQTAQHFCTETHDGDVCVGGFDAQMVNGCEQHLPQPDCTMARIKATIRQIGADTECHRYPPPGGVDFQSCVNDLNFYVGHC